MTPVLDCQITGPILRVSTSDNLVFRGILGHLLPCLSCKQFQASCRIQKSTRIRTPLSAKTSREPFPAPWGHNARQRFRRGDVTLLNLHIDPHQVNVAGTAAPIRIHLDTFRCLAPTRFFNYRLLEFLSSGPRDKAVGGPLQESASRDRGTGGILDRGPRQKHTAGLASGQGGHDPTDSPQVEGSQRIAERVAANCAVGARPPVPSSSVGRTSRPS